MPIHSKSLPKVPTNRREPALPVFTALCDEAQRRCSTQHGLPVTLCNEVRLRAWRLCWWALDAASAPANNLPETTDAQAWPPELVAQLRAAPVLPKLNAQTWQELRRARDQQLFTAVPLQERAAEESIADEALAAMLTQALARLGLKQLRGWVTPSVTAQITHWLSACLLAIDALALSDDDSDAAALELAVFVQSTLQHAHGAAMTTDDTAQSKLEHPAAVSGGHAFEAVRGGEAAAAAAIGSQPEASAAAPQPGAADAAAAPSAPQPAGAAEPPPSTSIADDTRVAVPQAAARPRRLKPQVIAQVAGAVAVGAGLLFILKTGNVAPTPDATQPTNQAKPPVTTPDPSAHVATPEPPVAQPVPNVPVAEPTDTPPPDTKQPTGTVNQRPRFRNLAAAKRAHAANKIDDAAYAAAVAELEALRARKIAKEQLELRRGKLSQRAYKRRVDAINRNLGFNRR